MINRDLNHQLQSLQSLFDRTGDACGKDIEMRSHWAKYLCVRCAGFLENSLKAVYTDYCFGATRDPVARYATQSLELIRNPKSHRFIQLASQFKIQWGQDLEKYINKNGRREAIDSIMSNRHLIAHGKTSTLTIVQIRDYFKKALEVVDFIEGQCKT